MAEHAAFNLLIEDCIYRLHLWINVFGHIENWQNLNALAEFERHIMPHFPGLFPN
jgi:hypothetical protein